ncbi:hypothetical protein ACOMHN_058033 [Nucella lapillus]
MTKGVVVWSRVAAVWSLVACVTYVAGLVTEGWLQSSPLDGHVGMWSECVEGRCGTLLRLDVGDWLITCQGLSITALLSSLLTLGLAAFMAKLSRDSSSTAIYGIIATSLFTGVVTAVSLTIFCVQSPLRYSSLTYTLSYSFFLVLGAGAMYVTQAVMLAAFCVILRCRHQANSSSAS